MGGMAHDGNNDEGGSDDKDDSEDEDGTEDEAGDAYDSDDEIGSVDEDHDRHHHITASRNGVSMCFLFCAAAAAGVGVVVLSATEARTSVQVERQGCSLVACQYVKRWTDAWTACHV